MSERIATHKRTVEIISKYEFAFQKRFGQNFLIDGNILDKIVSGSELTSEDYVIEIGPGIGSLTQYLAENAKKVIAIEIDAKLIPILEDTLSDYSNVEIIHNDILKVDLAELVREKCENKPVKVIANLPYYITTPIIMGLFENNVPVDCITVMVQKEVADRMKAKESTKEYGALSLAVQYYSEPYVIAHVPPNCFIPRPNVGSSVIRLKKYDKPPIQAINDELMFQIIRASFNQRRKTLLNSLSNGLSVSFTKEQIKEIIQKAELQETIRGEALSLSEFARLANVMQTYLNN